MLLTGMPHQILRKDPLEQAYQTRADEAVYPRLLQARPRWAPIATLLPSEAPAAVEAALHGALVDALKICPQGSWQSRGYFGSSRLFACCKPLGGGPPEMSVHGHCASAAHLSHQFGAPRSVAATAELRRLLYKSSVCGFQAPPGSDSEKLHEAIDQLFRAAWTRLWDARSRGWRWAATAEHGGVEAELRDAILTREINAPTSKAGGSAPRNTRGRTSL